MNETRQQKHAAIIRIGDLIEWNCRGCGKPPFESALQTGRNEWCAANCEIGKELRELGRFINGEKETVIVAKPKIDWEKELPVMREKKLAGMSMKKIAEEYGVSEASVFGHMKEEKVDKVFVPEDGGKPDVEEIDKDNSIFKNIIAAETKKNKFEFPNPYNKPKDERDKVDEPIFEQIADLQSSKVIARVEYDLLKKELDEKIERLQQLQEYVNQKNEDVETYQKDNMYLEEKVNTLEEQAKEKEESFLATLKLKDDQIASLQCSLNEKTTMLDFEKRKFLETQARLKLVAPIAKAYLEDVVS